MVAGFEHPEGDPAALDRAATQLGTMAGDLDSEAGTVRTGFSHALEQWKARRAEGFRSAGTTIDQSLNVGSGILEGAAAALGIYAGVLKTATDEIDHLKQQAEHQLTSARQDTSGPDRGPDPSVRAAAENAVEKLRREAERIREDTKSKASDAAATLNGAAGKLVPGGEGLSPADIATRVHSASGVDNARRAMAQDKLTLPDAWAALGGDPQQQAQNPLKRFFDTWGGFKPPDSQDPVSSSLYALGRLGTAGGRVAAWMTKVNHGRFLPRGADGRLIKIAGMSYWERLRAGAGRFPTAKGLSPWQRVRGFDKGGNFGAKGWRGAEYGRWSTAGKWVSRGGTVITAATSGWSEWQDSAGFPTDERAGRAVTKGATTAAGAWAGAEVGAWAGGAIGTAICPGVGTVIGGFVGGVIGGFAGSSLGSWAGDQIKDIGGEIGDKVGDGVKKVGGWLGLG